MGGIGWLLRKMLGSLMFAITWLITVLARVLRASVGRALGWLGVQLMKADDVAASADARIIPDEVVRPKMVLASQREAYEVTLTVIQTLSLSLLPQLAQAPVDTT